MPVRQPHEILQVSPNASRPVVEAAYLALMSSAPEDEGGVLTAAARAMLDRSADADPGGFEEMLLGGLLNTGNRVAVGTVPQLDGSAATLYRVEGSPWLHLGNRPLSPAMAASLYSSGKVRSLLVPPGTDGTLKEGAGRTDTRIGSPARDARGTTARK